MSNLTVSEREVVIIRAAEAEVSAIINALYSSAPCISCELELRIRDFIAGINAFEDISEVTMKGLRETAEEMEAILNVKTTGKLRCEDYDFE